MKDIILIRSVARKLIARSSKDGARAWALDNIERACLRHDFFSAEVWSDIVTTIGQFANGGTHASFVPSHPRRPRTTRVRRR
jgi:hypothetical protein